MSEEGPLFFETPTQLRAWFVANHETAGELWIGYWKKGTGRPSVTHPQAIDEALCVGWIDGIRKGVDAESYKNRFTPRRARSIWSQVNLNRMDELIAEGRVLRAGLKALETRDPTRVNQYSNEQQSIEFSPEQESALRANAAAWADWARRSPSYRRAATWWVISAKQEVTRQRRLATLIDDSANGRSVKPLTQPGGQNEGDQEWMRSR